MSKWLTVLVFSVVLLGCSNDGEPVTPVGPSPVVPGGTGTWRGLTVAQENRCSPYDAGDYSYSQSVEQRIVDQLGGVFSPYTCESFASTRETDIEHIVARSEAHDSGLCAASAATRSRFASDIRNLTLASPDLNRRDKGARDAAEWQPDRNRCWFANTVIEVRRAYDLTIDQLEVDALERMLSGCGGRTTIACDLPPDRTGPDPPPVRQFSNCAQMRAAGWTRGVRRAGGTYRTSWNAAERRTYSMNTARDGDRDGHACE